MSGFVRVLRGAALVGQLGVSIVTPPLVLILLAQYLISRYHWGLWVMAAAIVLGMAAAASSAWQLLRGILHQARNRDASEASFNQHI